MKRSRNIRLILLGSVSAGAFAGAQQKPPVTTAGVYTNDYQIPGVGYYHAPFRAFYQWPYNYYEARTGRYYYGGHWGAAPNESITNISAPTPQAAQLAESSRTDLPRGGFGGTAYGRSYYFGG